VAGLASYGAYAVYVDYVLAKGHGGNGYRQLPNLEDPYDPFALLLQGRSEWAVAATVIGDAPVFGHGSWAVDKTRRYAVMRARNTDTLDIYRVSASRREHLIPTHSVVLTGWIWGGLIGFAGSCALVWQVLRRFS